MMKQGKGKMGTRRLAFLAAVSIMATGSAVAAEVHTWTDEDGVVHFSDSPRTDGDSETLEVGEAYRPGTTGAYPAGKDTSTHAAESDRTAETRDESQVSFAQQRRTDMAESRRERREAQEELDQLCQRHRQRLAQVEPARRVFYEDESGELVRLDDNQRIGLVEESKAFIAKNCD